MSRELDFRLKNGLRVFVQESHAAPVVAIQAWIRVGSADERPEEAGVAHLLEHMMFKGTPKRGLGEVAGELEAAGGDVNAFTSFDQTVYHTTLAARHFSLGLDVLADVLQNSLIDAQELALEKEVVLEEVRRSQDNHARMLDQAMFRTVFTTHTYGRPVIGFEETVKGFGRDDVNGFFQRWYTPDNMVLVVVGDVDAQDVKRQVTRALGGFRRASEPRATRPEEPVQHAPRSVLLERTVQEAMMKLAFPLPDSNHPDIALFDLLALILGQGESSRLVEKVKHQQALVNSIGAYAYTPREPGMFLVGAGFTPDRLHDVYRAILEELHLLKQAPVRVSELRKAKNNLLSDRVYERETVDGRANKLGYNLQTWGNLEREKAYYRAIEEATPEDLWRVARAWLHPDRLNLGIMLPKGVPHPDQQAMLDLGRARLTEGMLESTAVLTGRREGETVRLELPNGIRLLVKETHAVPLVSIRAMMEGGLRYETPSDNGAFNLIAQMMTRGTPGRKAAQIAHEMESLAGGVSGFAGLSSFGLRAELLSQHLERGVELFTEILRGPSFDPHELERLRRLTGEAIRNQTDHPSSYVFKLFQEALFKRHPFRMSRLGTEKSLQRLTRSRLEQRYHQFARTNNLVLAVVGDVDARDVEHLFTRHLAELPQGTPDFPEVPAEPPRSRAQSLHVENDKQQVHLVIGWRSVALDHPDRHALSVLNAILSGQSGRLFMELRDKQGLAYSVTSTAMESVGEGYFALYMGTEPGKLSRARDGLFQEMHKLLDHGVTATELSRAQKTLIGGYEIELQRSSALCGNIAMNELYGLGYDAYKQYPSQVEAVTCEHVLDVAQRYLVPGQHVMVALGPRVPGLRD